MSSYESHIIITQNHPAQDVSKITENYEGLVEKMGGNTVKKEYWGLKNLAYEIKKNKKGRYVFLGIDAPSSTINKIENNFKKVSNTNVFLYKNYFIFLIKFL
jgi:small subunit ribosomal protein S6